MKQWPKTGSKVIFNGAGKFHFFPKLIEDANNLLEVGKEYTIKKIKLASSWCGVVLEEFPDHKFSLNWFAHDKDLTTEEVRMNELDASETVKYAFTSLKELRDRK